MSEWRAHYTEWLDEIEAAQPGLNQRVLCVYLGRRVDRIGRAKRWSRDPEKEENTRERRHFSMMAAGA